MGGTRRRPWSPNILVLAIVLAVLAGVAGTAAAMDDEGWQSDPVESSQQGDLSDEDASQDAPSPGLGEEPSRIDDPDGCGSGPGCGGSGQSPQQLGQDDERAAAVTDGQGGGPAPASPGGDDASGSDAPSSPGPGRGGGSSTPVAQAPPATGTPAPPGAGGPTPAPEAPATPTPQAPAAGVIPRVRVAPKPGTGIGPPAGAPQSPAAGEPAAPAAPEPPDGPEIPFVGSLDSELAEAWQEIERVAVEVAEDRQELIDSGSQTLDEAGDLLADPGNGQEWADAGASALGTAGELVDALARSRIWAARGRPTRTPASSARTTSSGSGSPSRPREPPAPSSCRQSQAHQVV
jgi:hypothetical protein